jgi:hypothetical protein
MSSAVDRAPRNTRANPSTPATRFRWRAVLGASALGTAIVIGLLVLPLYYGGLNWRVRLAGNAGVAAVGVALLTLRPSKLAGMRVGPEAWARLDTAAEWVLGRGLPAVVLGTSLVLFAGWAPHYLTWPIWSDSDQFAVSARAWHDGLRPYRDLPDFDFPGPIYLFWVLGRVFGWGRTAPFYAFDAACVGLLGVASVGWSRRRFGRALPGLVGYLMFLWVYVSLNYLRVAQRDWQATLAVTLGLMALEAWPGRAGRVVAAAAVGAALAFRPQPVVFLPALVAAVAANARRRNGSPEPIGRALSEWFALLTLAVLVAFGPILLAGVADDFIRVLGVTSYGGSYNRFTWSRFWAGVIEQLEDWRLAWMFPVLGVLAVWARGPIRGPARVWGLALIGALAYKPISPVLHGYLSLPLILVGSIGAAIVVAWFVDQPRLVPAVRVLAVCGVIAAGIHVRPWMFNPRASARVLVALIRGETPVGLPPGCRSPFVRRSPYQWDDYQAVLSYLRRSTAPDTPVANVLRRFPFPSLNGPAGRPSPFPAANGVLYLWWVDSSLEPQFVRALEMMSSGVVVWSPGEEPTAPALKLKGLEATIRRLYRPVARFGRIEIWRRSDAVEREIPEAGASTLRPA